MANSCFITPSLGKDYLDNDVFSDLFNELTLVFGRKISMLIYGYTKSAEFKNKHKLTNKNSKGEYLYVDVIDAIKSDKQFLNDPNFKIIKDALELLNLDSQGIPRWHTNLAKLSKKINEFNKKYDENLTCAIVENVLDEDKNVSKYRVLVKDLNMRSVLEASIVDAQITQIESMLSLFESRGLKIDVENKNIIANRVYDITNAPTLLSNFKQIYGYNRQNNDLNDNAFTTKEKTLSIIHDWIDYVKQHVTFDSDTHTYYIDGNPVDYSVTQYAGSVLGEKQIQGDYSHSTAIGNTIDVLSRDFFMGVDVINTDYPNLDLKRKEEVIKDLEYIKQCLDLRFGGGQYTVITEEFPLVGKVTTPQGEKIVAGTMDMCVIDNQGKVHIFDFKTKNKTINNDISQETINEEYAAQQNIYKRILETLDPSIEVESLQLIWYKTDYPKITDKKYSVEDGQVYFVEKDYMGVPYKVPIQTSDAYKTPHFENFVPIKITDLIKNLSLSGLSAFRSIGIPFIKGDSTNTEESLDIELTPAFYALVAYAMYNSTYALDLIKLFDDDFIDKMEQLLDDTIKIKIANFNQEEKNQYILTLLLRNRDSDIVSNLGLSNNLNRIFNSFIEKYQFTQEEIKQIYEDAKSKLKNKTIINSINEISNLHTPDENLVYMINKLLNLINKRIRTSAIKGENFSKKSFAIYRSAIDLKKELQLEDSFVECIHELMTSFQDTYDNIYEMLNESEHFDDLNMNSIAGQYLKLNSLISLYKPILQDIKRYTRDNLLTKDIDQKELFLLAEQKVSEYIDMVESKLRDIRKGISLGVLRSIANLEQFHTGTNPEESVNFEKLLDEIDYDASLWDAQTASLADSSDLISALAAKLIKSAANKRDMQIIKDQNTIQEITDELLKSGITTFEWMLEKNEKGELTGNFFGEYNVDKYHADMLEAYKKIDEDDSLTNAQKMNEKYKWDKAHTQNMYIYVNSDGSLLKSLVKKNGWKSIKIPAKQYKRVTFDSTYNSWSNAQKRYYNKMMELKIQKELLAPKGQRDIWRMPLISKSATTVLKEQGIKEYMKFIGDDAKTKLFRNQDLIRFKYDANDELINTVPISFTRRIDPKTISTDVSSIMNAYQTSVNHYSTISEHVNSLLVLKEQLQHRRVYKVSKKNEKDENGVSHPHFVEGGNYYKRFCTYLDYYIFNSKTLDTYYKNKFKGKKFLTEQDYISTQGIISAIKSYSSMTALGLNPKVGMANIIAGKYQMFIEAAGGEYFGFKELATSEKEYWANIIQCLGESGLKKTNKMNVLIQQFDMLDEFYEASLEKTFDSSALKDLIKHSNLMILLKIGEHYLHVRTGICVLLHQKVMKDGKKMSLYDAITVDKDGNMSYDGITYEDGKEFDQNEFFKIRDRINTVNRRLHGAFNKADRGAINANAFGSLLMQFRQWMPAVYQHRFGFKGIWNMETGEKEYGFYVQSAKAIKNVISDLRKLKSFSFIWHNTLTKRDKIALRKLVTELSCMGAVGLFLRFMFMFGGGGDDDDPGAFYKLCYDQLRRLNLELSAYGNIFDLGAMKDSILEIVSSPFASLRQIDGTLGIFNVWDIFRTVDKGFFAGHSYYVKDLAYSIPIVSSVIKTAKTIEEGLEK